jgi:charged multivesicular body protein 6
MSNQDEDEVEDELEALEAELSIIELPDAPATKIELSEVEKKQLAKARAQKRARERAAEQAEPMLAQ